MNDYAGQVFDDSLDNGKEQAHLRLYDHKIKATTTSGRNFTLSLHSLRMSIGGVDKDFLYLRPSSSQKTVFICKAQGLLEEFRQNKLENIQRQLVSIRHEKKKKRNLHYLSAAGFTAILIAIATFIAGYGVRFAVALLPHSVDEKLGEIAYNSSIKEIAGHNEPMKNQLINNTVNHLVQKLTSSLEKKNYNYEVKVIQSPVNNAFALPGGKLVVLTGLLKSASSLEEVAGVIAHEIGHVKERHGMQKVIQSVGILLTIQVLLGDTSALTRFVAHGASSLAGLGFSRDMEKEADLIGFQLLIKAGISPDGLIHFFETLETKETKDITRQYEWLLSHPQTKERIKILRGQKAGKTKKKFKPLTKTLNVSWSQIKRALRN